MASPKNTQVNKFTLISKDGSRVTPLTGVGAIYYYEDIFEPNIRIEAYLVGIDDIISDYPVTGGEIVELSIDSQTGSFEFSRDNGNELYVNGTPNLLKGSLKNSYVFDLRRKQAGDNLLVANRCTKKYEDLTISAHVEDILLNNLKITEDDILGIEETANNISFFGNNWKPFKAIHWMAPRGRSKVGGENFGFCFWQNYNGFTFKSIDRLIEDAKNADNVVKVFTQKEACDRPVSDDTDRILSVVINRNQDLLDSLSLGQFGKNTFNYGVVGQFNAFDPKLNKNEVTLGLDKIPENIWTKGPSLLGLNMVSEGTFNVDGKIAFGKDFAKDISFAESLGRFRYASLLSQSVDIQVPYNAEVQAGEVVKIRIIKSNEGYDPTFSGLYLVKSICHSYIDGEGFSSMRLVRDGYGDASTTSQTNSLLTQ